MLCPRIALPLVLVYAGIAAKAIMLNAAIRQTILVFSNVDSKRYGFSFTGIPQEAELGGEPLDMRGI